MTISNFLYRKGQAVDDAIWRLIFGPEDYMNLHPPLGLRCKVGALLPFRLMFGGLCHDTPIFIVGAPRSGTTLLFSLLRESSELLSFGQESHWAWEKFHRPINSSSQSQIIEPNDLTPFTSRFIRGCYSSAFGKQRFVDKSPMNSLRVKAIHRLFPDAHIVCITRNGLDNISSLMDCWLDPVNFSGFDVPEHLNIEGYGKQKWSMILQPDWRSVTNSPLVEVCCHQWLKVNEYILSNKSEIPNSQWHDVRYENLVENPTETTEELCRRVSLPYSQTISSFAERMSSRVVNTNTKPGIGKWKDQRHSKQINGIIDKVLPMMNSLGYNIDEFVEPNTLASPEART